MSTGAVWYIYDITVQYAENVQNYLASAFPNLLYVVAGSASVNVYFGSTLTQNDLTLLDTMMASYVDPTLAPKHPRLPNSVTVSKNGRADFSRVEDAVAYANSILPSAVVIMVYAGVYNLSNGLLLSSGVSLVSVDGPSSCIISYNNGPIVTLTGGSHLRGVGLQGNMSTGSIGIFHNGSDGGKVVVNNCRLTALDSGLLSMGGGVCVVERLGVGGTSNLHVNHGVHASDGSTLRINELLCSGYTSSMTSGLYISGINTCCSIGNSVIRYCTSGAVIDNGSLDCNSVRFKNCNSACVITSDGAVSCLIQDALLENSTLWDFDIQAVPSAVGRLMVTGCFLETQKVNNPNGVSVISSLVTPDGHVFSGNVQIGDPVSGGGSGSSAMVGRGLADKYSIRLLNNTFESTGTWTDLSNSIGGTPFNLVPSGQVGQAFYIGLSSLFAGLSVTLDVSGNGSGIWEYWNGTEWVTFSVMCKQAVSPWTLSGNVVFEGSPSQWYVFFGNVSSWTTLSLDGLDKYWVRYRYTISASIVPKCSFVVPVGDASLIEKIGFTLRFGAAQSLKIWPFECKTNWKHQTFPPTEISLWSSTMVLPSDINTAWPIQLCWSWCVPNAVSGGGNILWQIQHAILGSTTAFISFDPDNWFTTASDKTQSLTQNVDVGQGMITLRSKVSLDVAGALSGLDNIAFAITRVGIDVTDTLQETPILLHAYLRYVSFMDGSPLSML